MSTGKDSPVLKMVSLPHELVTEILTWLPVKSLTGFKSACKPWRDTIQEHDFTHLHMIRNALRYPSMIMWETYTLEPDSNDDKESFINVSFINGLMLERSCRSANKYRIRNPSTKCILHLPSPNHTEPATMCTSIRFVAKTKEYKLVSYNLDKKTNWLGLEVLTIEADSAWRPLDVPTYNLDINAIAIRGNIRFRFIDDVLYILVLSMAGDPGVICFDMATEQFKELKIPSCLFLDRNNVQIVQWNGKFSITKLVQERIHAWILEDYKNSKWGDQKIVISPAPGILEAHPQFTEYGSVYITGNEMGFYDKGRNFFAYDIKSGKVRQCISKPSGNKYYVAYRPSMIYFRGMQREA